MTLDKELEQTIIRNEQRISGLEKDVTEIKGDIKAIKKDIYVIRNNDIKEVQRGKKFWLEVLGLSTVLALIVEYGLRYFLRV